MQCDAKHDGRMQKHSLCKKQMKEKNVQWREKNMWWPLQWPQWQHCCNKKTVCNTVSPLQWRPVFYYTQNLMKNKKNSLPQHNIVYHDDHTNILQHKLWQCSKKQKPQSSKKKGEPKKQPSERLDTTQKRPNVHLGIMTIGLESQNI